MNLFRRIFKTDQQQEPATTSNGTAVDFAPPSKDANPAMSELNPTPEAPETPDAPSENETFSTEQPLAADVAGTEPDFPESADDAQGSEPSPADSLREPAAALDDTAESTPVDPDAAPVQTPSSAVSEPDFIADIPTAEADSELSDTTPRPAAKATAPLPSTGELFTAFADGGTRPLPQDSFLDVAPLTHAIYGQATDVGRMRSNNQDSMYSFFASGRGSDAQPDFGLFVLADGMGGHQDGEKASSLTTKTVTSRVLDSMYFPLVLQIGSTGDSPITETLAEAVQKANSEVIAKVPDGGTTCSAVVMIGDRAYVAHVGDSRIYLFHHGILEKLTRDHSLVQRLIELDQITTDEAAEHPQKNVLYRALGQNESIEVDTLTKRLPTGGMLLLCSDGLWNQVTDGEITDIITKHRNPQEACQKLIMLANARGGVDNVTVILIHLPG